MAEAAANAILARSYDTSDGTSLARHLLLISRFLRSDESLARLPLVIPRALLSLCNEELYTKDHRGQLFACLGSFLRLQYWYRKQQNKNALLRGFFVQSERLVLHAAQSGRQQMVVPLAAVILYTSEVAAITHRLHKPTVWNYVSRKDDISCVILTIRVISGTLRCWCDTEGSLMPNNRLQTEGITKVAKRGGSSNFDNANEWTVTDFHSLMFATEKAILNLFEAYPLVRQEQAILEKVVTALDFPAKETTRSRVLRAVVGAGALLATHSGNLNKPYQRMRERLLQKCSAGANVVLAGDSEALVSYLLAISRIREHLQAHSFPMSVQEELASSIVPLFVPVSEPRYKNLQDSSRAILQLYQEEIAAACAHFANNTSLSCKLATLILDDIRRAHDAVRRKTSDIRGDTHHEVEIPRLPQVPSMAQARPSRIDNMSLPQKKNGKVIMEEENTDDQQLVYETEPKACNEKETIDDLLVDCPYYKGGVIKSILVFLRQSVSLQAPKSSRDFAVVALRIMSYLPAIPGLSDSLFHDLIPVAFQDPSKSPFSELIAPLCHSSTDLAGPQMSFILALLQQAALLNSQDVIESSLSTILPKLSSMIMGNSNFSPQALAAVQTVVRLPLRQERSCKLIHSLWRQFLNADVDESVLNAVLDPILQGESPDQLSLCCVDTLASAVLNDCEEAEHKAEIQHDDLKPAELGKSWKGRGLEGILARSLLNCKMQILPLVAEHVERAASSGNRDLAKSLIELALQAVEISDLERKLWLVHWSLQLAKKLNINVHMRTSRSRL